MICFWVIESEEGGFGQGLCLVMLGVWVRMIEAGDRFEFLGLKLGWDDWWC